MSAKSKKATAGGPPPAPLPPKPIDAGEHLDAMFKAYAMYVIEDRAVPSVCDGLKPVHRRLAWAALTMSPAAVPGSPTVKNARITGETMSKFHPHGDAYLSLVRMAQPFAMRVPLFDFQGNYGSADFGPAASRYTESRLSVAGMALLAQVRDGTVDLVENYDGLNVEPVVLPAGYPNLLVNGSLGIAVGMSSMIPCHNPIEVVAAARMLIDNPKATVEELMTLLPGPDYPDPCQIINGDELASVYRSGSGQVRVRGIWEVDETKAGLRIIVTSLPYSDGSTGSGEKFIADLVKAVTDNQMSGIDNVVNESAKGHLRIVIDVTRGVPVEQVIPGLLRYTNLQVTNAVRLHALDAQGHPQMFNLRTMLEAWVQHRVDCIERRSLKRIDAINERLHLLRGLLAALIDIDAAVAIIRSADDVPEARTGLMARFSIDELQANYILDLTLRRLTRLATIEVQTEHDQLTAELARLELLVSSPARLRRRVGKELDDTSAKLFDAADPKMARRTEITNAIAMISTAATVVDSPIDVFVTDTGYVQAFKPGRARERGMKEGTVLHRLSTSTASQVVALTELGQLHRILGVTIPADKATALPNIVNGIKPTERIVVWGVTRSSSDDSSTATIEDFPTELLLVTSAGTIKRIGGDDLTGGDRKGGISVIKLATNDDGTPETIVAALPWNDAVPYLLMSANGQAIRFVPDDVRPMGRTAAGVRGIKLAAGDRVVGAISAADDDHLLVVHRRGPAKRIQCADFPVQGRAGKGVRATVVSTKSGPVQLAVSMSAGTSRLVSVAGAWSTVELAAAPMLGREAPAGKIRGFDGVIEAIV